MPPTLSIRFLIKSGDLPQVTDCVDLDENKNDEFLRALQHGTNNMFRQLSSLFQRDPETDIGLGIGCMYGLVGDVYAGARELVKAVSLQQHLAVLDLTSIRQRALDSLTIQQMVDYILNSPPRCAILVNITSHEDRMYKVMKRLARTEITRCRRIVFCMTRDEADLHLGIPRLYFPGTVDDRTATLLYLVPSKFADPDRLRAIAEKLRDYTVFQPNIQRLLNRNGTLEEYFSSLQYQVVKRNGVLADDRLDDFPSFEVPWRRSLSAHLQTSLVPSPDVTSSAIHRVLPVGASQIEALRCFQSALPPDLKSPYVLTVESNASDDKCGSIAITQRTQHVVIHINCSVDPGILSEVCRELRLGYRSVVRELSHTKSEMDKKFVSLQEDISLLKDLVKAGSGDRKRERDLDEDLQLKNPICTRRTCMNPVTDRFASGAFKKQCATCIRHSNSAKKERTPENSE